MVKTSIFAKQWNEGQLLLSCMVAKGIDIVSWEKELLWKLKGK